MLPSWPHPYAQDGILGWQGIHRIEDQIGDDLQDFPSHHFRCGRTFNLFTNLDFLLPNAGGVDLESRLSYLTYVAFGRHSVLSKVAQGFASNTSNYLYLGFCKFKIGS